MSTLDWQIEEKLRNQIDELAKRNADQAKRNADLAKRIADLAKQLAKLDAQLETLLGKHRHDQSEVSIVCYF